MKQLKLICRDRVSKFTFEPY